MKKNKSKYLKYYLDYANRLMMPDPGLCSAFKGEPEFDLVKPNRDDKLRLDTESKCAVWWGSDQIGTGLNDFTPLRQTLVLLMAALNNEL